VAIEIIPADNTALDSIQAVEYLLRRFTNEGHPCWQGSQVIVAGSEKADSPKINAQGHTDSKWEGDRENLSSPAGVKEKDSSAPVGVLLEGQQCQSLGKRTKMRRIRQNMSRMP